ISSKGWVKIVQKNNWLQSLNDCPWDHGDLDSSQPRSGPIRNPKIKEWENPLWKFTYSTSPIKKAPMTSKSGMVPPIAPQRSALLLIFSLPPLQQQQHLKQSGSVSPRDHRIKVKNSA